MKTTSLAANRLNTPHILLVDDNRNGLIVRKALLEEMGCRVQTAVDGQEAFELYGSRHFDLVVTDYRMPRMNGQELIVRIRGCNPQAAIILLSGFVEPLGLTERSTGADAVLAKSANEPQQLLRAVKRLLQPAKRKPLARQASPVNGVGRASGD